jgi:RNA polymerase sigma factor for flagellar operon FliA
MEEKAVSQASEVHRLWEEYSTNKNSVIRDKLVEHYLSLVKMVAGRVAISLPQYVDKDDLTGNGFLGLIEAIDRYDFSRGIKFETYAVARIRGAILDSLRAQDWIPTTVRQKARQYEQTLTNLENSLGRSATDEEISEALNISVQQLHSLLNTINGCTLIPLEDYIKVEVPTHSDANPSQYLEEAEIKDTLAKAIEKLSEKERLVVTLYYYEGLTLKEISLILKLTEARISQLHTKAIFRLRGALSRVKANLL